MYEQFWRWTDATVAALQLEHSIGSLQLPDPNDTEGVLDLGLVDPTTACLIVGFAQQRHYEAPLVYVGTVAQEPLGTWRGLTGFYLNWCPGCEDGNKTVKVLMRDLASHGVVAFSIWDVRIPRALQPRSGWFEHEGRERLQYAAFLNTRPGLDTHWKPVSAHETGACLITTGPVTSSLANVVLIESQGTGIDALRRITRSHGYWSVRKGDLDELEQLAGMPPTPAIPTTSTVERRRDLPVAWGTFRVEGESTTCGPVPNLAREVGPLLSTAPGHKPTPVHVTYLPQGKPARLSDIEALTPASS